MSAEEPKIIEEPVIKEAVTKKKLSTLKYKIDPELPFFPGTGGQKIKSLFDQFKFEEALKEEVKDEDLKLRVSYWEAKAYYTMGDYKTALEKADAQVKVINEKYPETVISAEKEQVILSFADEDDNKSTIKEIKKIEVPPKISYLILKYKLLQARLNKAIGKNGQAHDIVNEILLYVKLFREQTPSKFWMVAVKACQVQMTQLCNAKEFDAALLMMKNFGQKITGEVSEHYLPTEEKDEGKILQDNYYSFNYRKAQAQYHIYFQDFKNAEEQLRGLLQDELKFYEMLKKPQTTEEEKKEKPKFQPIDLDQIDHSNLKDKDLTGSQEYQYSSKSHPFFKILQTLMLLADVFSYRLQSEEALKIFNYVQDGYFLLFGNHNTILNSYLIQQKSECFLRQVTERNPKPVESGVELAEESVKLMEMCVGTKPNFLMALRIQTLADALRDAEKFEESESQYVKCQTMIGVMFGEDHPAIVPYNGNLVTCYSNTKDEEKRKERQDTIKQIIEKNFKIAESTYGEESIHLLYHVSGNLINKLALGEIISPSAANPLIQKMRKIITKFHDNDPRRLSNQLLFQVQLLYAQMLSGTMSHESSVGVELLSMVSEIYSYVISAQVKYCKMDMKHPFLEQTFLNIAIFNRSMKKFADSLQMWKLLEGLQKEMYGENSYNLLFTLKNIGTCFLGVGNSEKAREYFEQCIELLEKCKTDKPEIIRKDKEEASALQQNLYLTFVSDRNYKEALESSEKVITIMAELYGPRSKRLSSKYYQKANSLLNLRRRVEAIEAIESAISIFENPDPEPESNTTAVVVPAQQLDFNRIQYQNFLCSCLYIQGQDFERVKKECVKGIELCKNFKFELLIPEAEKLRIEFEGIKLKSTAKIQKMSALDLKEQQDLENKMHSEVKTLAQNSSISMTTATTVLLMSSAAAYCALIAYQKMNK